MIQEGYPGAWRYIILTVSLLEILCFSAIIYGWGSLVYVLKEEGFLADLCPNKTAMVPDGNLTNVSQTSLNPDCDQRDARFNLYFTLISSVGVFLILIVGHSLTKLGTRTTRLIFITMFGLGCLCIAASNTGYPWLICFGGILMIGSGNVYTITSIQFTKLFPDHASTIVGLMNGMKVSSSFTQQLVKIAHDNGVSRRISYCCLVGLVSLTYLTTIFLFPRGIPSDKETKTDENKESSKLDLNKKENNMRASKSQDNRSITRSESNALIASSPQINVVKYTVDKTTDIVEKLKSSTCTELSDGEKIFAGKTVVSDTNVQKSSYDNLGFNELGSKDNSSQIDKKHKDTEENAYKTDQLFRGKTDEGYGTNEKSKDVPSSNSKMESKLSVNMCGYLYMFNVLWFTIIKFWANYFYGTINPLTEKITRHDKSKGNHNKHHFNPSQDDKFLDRSKTKEKVAGDIANCVSIRRSEPNKPYQDTNPIYVTISVSYYADVLSYSMAGGIVGCIVVGLLYDWQRRFFVHINDLKRRRVMSSVGPLFTACIVSIILSALLFVNDEWVLIALPVIFTLFRALLTTVGNTFLVDMFPASIYGTIYGVRFVIANIFSLVQYALFEWSLAYKGAEFHVDVFVLCLCLATFIHPMSIVLANRQTKNPMIDFNKISQELFFGEPLPDSTKEFGQ